MKRTLQNLSSNNLDLLDITLILIKNFINQQISNLFIQ